MKNFKRITALVLVLVMALTVYDGPVNTHAKIKILTEKNIKLILGKKDTIYTNAKGVKYKTTNKKVATVDKKGNVVAKGVGSCKIKISKGKEKATVNVKVALAQVKNVQTEISNITSARIKYDSVKGATGYTIYRSLSKNGKYTRVATAKGTTAYVNNLETPKTYYFKVKASKGKVLSFEYSKPAILKTYKLAWSEEFNDNKLDTSVWNIIEADGGFGNQELQKYMANGYHKFEDGKFVIMPTYDFNTSTGKVDADRVFSAKITSEKLKTFKYGMFEIRAKAAKGKGAWSAGWMLGDGTGAGKWPFDGEIDIMESMNGATPQTIHCGYYNNQSWSHGNKNFSSGISQKQASNEYHTYGFIWTEDYIQFTVDGEYKGKYEPKKLWSYTASESNAVNLWDGAFMHPFYFILNCAVGGNAAGAVTREGWDLISKRGNIETYQSYFSIDYIRVYQ